MRTRSTSEFVHPAFTEQHPTLQPAVPTADPLAGIDLSNPDALQGADAAERKVLRELEQLANAHREEAAKLQEEVRSRTKAAGGASAATTAFGSSGGVSDIMVEECKTLLRLMGVPYLVAPAEAEAQCAVLEELGYVDGVVTDDSDALIFGAKHVYRHMFERRRFVQLYRASTIEQAIGLSRDHLVAMTLLLGSDYTPGIRGIGKVNAIEVVSVFGPTLSGLEAFRKWVYSGERTTRPNLSAEDLSPTLSEAERSARIKRYLLDLFKFKHRHIRGTWGISTNFPDRTVYEAYLSPIAERSPENLKFDWSRPIQEEELALFMNRTLGWDFSNTQRLLEPVRRAATSGNTTQSRILAYYGPTGRFAAPSLLDVVAEHLGGSPGELKDSEGRPYASVGGEVLFGWESSALAKSKRVQAAVAILKQPDSIAALEKAVQYSHEAELEEIGHEFADTLLPPESEDEEEVQEKLNRARRSKFAKPHDSEAGEAETQPKRRRKEKPNTPESANLPKPRKKRVKTADDNVNGETSSLALDAASKPDREKEKATDV